MGVTVHRILRFVQCCESCVGRRSQRSGMRILGSKSVSRLHR
ncbi:hypothetical protein HMPREF0724_13648 [Prescottella equi ATCC 33707]|uniref:Uncharacterized protein n=1 Tax=Prescottella equi ATCC 33707 TaxID=525370 RepID=E9T520_RHOHA|nr:hypothetical protein HMPREF0724_13648 [Prescottella equi ATCC 33707]